MSPWHCLILINLTSLLSNFSFNVSLLPLTGSQNKQMCQSPWLDEMNIYQCMLLFIVVNNIITRHLLLFPDMFVSDCLTTTKTGGQKCFLFHSCVNKRLLTPTRLMAISCVATRSSFVNVLVFHQQVAPVPTGFILFVIPRTKEVKSFFFFVTSVYLLITECGRRCITKQAF